MSFWLLLAICRKASSSFSGNTLPLEKFNMTGILLSFLIHIVNYIGNKNQHAAHDM
ncbi:hypothetical protein ECEC1846_3768 [Escherichia coli EC1846]|uniref:Uncharacterized protein n=1 Tax=Escherichia coli O157:H7 (strain EC869) TaxID=478008 RepID=A0A0H3PMS1_ECO5C|nr:hypothetical protein ECH74115_3867 [Escherichia coli O157:H7 str. EC4115]EDU33386.1 hypothetical protein ECH7EC4196_1417 [Escherichia coli O157:H7 str. EC4196]EDU51733.1 hypothetical protein ECH7EC4113_1663 [Escherichia coli O157:H7 str. EC4113]EDU72308.1 hypothetical protein ECH7EC4076_2813 [Escherichia coli O157:H7 str. EC4076]EDU75676.1 hypothetical protein ECH7EC4401_0323 [Escherichia coli O157:H7 str. EC4401]EDU80538.1 hypothetical protein ECH7EC4486_2525 [Escherichia coli O157:H7 str.